MNDHQKRIIDRAIERALREIDALERKKRQGASLEIESYRAEIEMLKDGKFMEGLFKSLAAVQRGERGVGLKEIKRKYKRA
jgi:hypothetical protein